MKTAKISRMFLLVVITVGLFLFEMKFDGKLSERLKLNRTSRKRNQQISDKTITDIEEKGRICPKAPIAKADALGLLANQIDTYVNHIALQWEYGYQLYLSDTIFTNMQNLFHNMTYPPSSQLDQCNITYWTKASDWVAFTSFLAKEMETCRQNTKETFDTEAFVDTCIRKTEKEHLNVNSKTEHNKPDWLLLEKHLPDIKKYHLQFNRQLTLLTEETIKQQINVTHKENLVYIGVHIRRGDFGGYTRFGHKMIDEKYYQAGLDYYRVKYGSRSIFLLLSDDMAWCREKFSAEDVFLIGGGSRELDLALLSSTNHTLIAYGTYGLWGGVLAGGEVVIPKSIELYTGTASETAARVLGWTLLPGF